MDELLAYLNGVRAILNQPIQHTRATTAETAFLLRADCDVARYLLDKAIEAAINTIPSHPDVDPDE